MILLILANHFATYKGTIRAYERRQEHLRRLSPLFDFLERHYSEQIVISDAASLVGMSNSHFRRFFKQTTGQSFVTYLNHFRIARAQEVLESSDKTIAEVGLDVGFCDQSYFGLVFRRLTKITPLEYRQRSRTQPMENFDPPIPNVSRAPCGQTNRPKFRADE
jgi:AraC-like DNA-binding protein